MLLEVHNLSASYGAIRALRAANLCIDVGEMVALIGANGAGKSTFLRTLSGLLAADHGQVRVDGRDVTRLAPHELVALGICHVPEGRHVFGPLTVLENLWLGAYRRRDPSTIQADLMSVFELFPVLRERQHQRAGTLSGGEQQMLAIGRGLMAQPRLLMLDEPSQGLAPRVIDSIFDVLVRLNQSGLSMLLVEQNASLALDVAHRGYVMESGEVVLEGPCRFIRDNDRVAELYLGTRVSTGAGG